ncbi:uncharacterized protein LOC133301240 [Gastrolobium bilobum]|uniref:uncharacterized protein LOC133301240 n=1 Tax=Gastrolobium bilobum TaxID=150636 RepID=UPI002AB3101C|nr:uncharacterized protein LOC133301240 [Gastrolobium bilobum]
MVRPRGPQQEGPSNAPEDLITTIGGLATFVQNMSQEWRDYGNHNPNQHPTQIDEEEVARRRLKDFRNFQPPTFEGGDNPEMAAHWLQMIEHIFERMDCPEAQKVNYASYQLVGEIERFESGLHPEIRKLILSSANCTLPELINESRQAEGIINDAKALSRQSALQQGGSRIGRFFKKFTGQNKGKGTHMQARTGNFKKNTATGPSSAGRQSYPTCTYCGKNHPGACRRKNNLCYNCGESRPFAADCPQNTNQARPNQPPTQGRVFTLDANEARKHPNLIQGNVILNGYPISVIFDSGATGSFIAEYTALRLGITPAPLPFDMHIHTPAGGYCTAAGICRGVILQFEGRTYTINLVVLPVFSIEMIIGMDWLSENNVKLDCQAGKVIVPPLNDNSLFFSTISLLQVRKELLRGAEGYLLLSLSEDAVDVSLRNIPIVNEFVEVFPDEIPQIPPHREIEFPIELLPGVGPVSIAPYRMSPLELRELKKQLEELLS